MSEANDWNAAVIEEFRANEGRVGGPFAGAPLVLVHHRGRSSGREYVAPLMYLADDADPATIYIFASKAGRYEVFAGYAAKTAGVRTIPVLALRRV